MFKCLLYTLSIFPIALYSQSYSGKIIRVIDGDMLLFLTEDSTFTIHLYGIDAPEKGQVFGERTINHLEAYLWVNAKIQLKRDINREGISVLLFIKGTNINKDLVKNGYAWYDRPHCIDAELARAEEHAREKKLGLWRNPKAVSPWDFRNGILARPSPTNGKYSVLICTTATDNHYHKKYCLDLTLCHGNVIVISKKQARSLHMKPCKYCF
jgi:micrococcal nuclease